MRIGDLFSGAGGLTFGFYYQLVDGQFIETDNEFLFANEYDEHAAAAFHANYPKEDLPAPSPLPSNLVLPEREGLQLSPLLFCDRSGARQTSLRPSPPDTPLFALSGPVYLFRFSKDHPPSPNRPPSQHTHTHTNSQKNKSY